MNKEQILGTLLINGYITIDELNILNDTRKSIDMSIENIENEKRNKRFDWLDQIKQQPIKKESNIYTSNDNSLCLVQFLNDRINGR